MSIILYIHMVIKYGIIFVYFLIFIFFSYFSFLNELAYTLGKTLNKYHGNGYLWLFFDFTSNDSYTSPMNIKFAIDFRLTLIIIEVFSFSEYAIFFSREHLSSFNLNFITRFFFCTYLVIFSTLILLMKCIMI